MEKKIKEYVGRYACLGDSEHIYDIKRAYENKINALVEFLFWKFNEGGQNNGRNLWRKFRRY